MDSKELQAMLDDPTFRDIFLPLYQGYKQLDREFDKKVVNKDIENLFKKLDTITHAQERRKAKK